ncbi:MAG: VOC family protein [Chloroflexi bacterium]|nr:VOC family protein [Chloroflexota bacterium]
MGVIQLGYAGLAAPELESWDRLAREVLGAEVRDRSDQALYLRFDEYHHRLIVQQDSPPDLLFAGWMLAGPREFEAQLAALRQHDIPFRMATDEELRQRKVRQMAWCTDPDGLRVELFWGLLTLPREPFVPTRAMQGFKAGSLGLGHLVVWSNERQASERFYCDVLQFKLSDYGSGRAAFLRCNPRHHSLALAQSRPDSGDQRLRHVMLEVNELDDVGRAYDLCEDRWPLVSTLGRHPNDRMVSFYLKTPSGFALEYGWGARLVDEESWTLQAYEPGDVWGHKPIA